MKKATKQKPKKECFIGLYVEPLLMTRIMREAEEERRTTSNFVRTLIERELERRATA